MLKRRALLLGAPAALAACAMKERVYADQSAVDAAFAPNRGAPKVEVFSSFNVGTNNGAHTALLIHADERVVFDPAGTFAHRLLPERHDVIYGMNDSARRAFVDYHTRETFWTTLQSWEVPLETARIVQANAEQAGPVADGRCTRATSAVLANAPGLGFDVRTVWFPSALHDQLLDKPGVTRLEFHQDDDADKEKYWETATL